MVRLITFLALALSFSLCNSQEKWDDKNDIYTNNNLYFHWDLPEEFEWTKVQPYEKHTVFKANSDFGVTAFVNLQIFNEEIPDNLWENFETIKPMYAESIKKADKVTGTKTVITDFTKCYFVGNKAIRCTSEAKLIDDVQNMYIYSMSYQFLKWNSFWQVTVKCTKEVYDIIGEKGLKLIFAGFGLNAKPANKKLQP